MALPASITDELLATLTAQVAADEGLGDYKMLEVYTGEVLTTLPQSSPADIVGAVAAAPWCWSTTPRSST
jgi:aldehyde dehydrogenase (NAD+)/succinate-semialdehyde dehydrogenase/glutarate-semialdehyde dehydrogenase